jgi:hypothetical protein
MAQKKKAEDKPTKDKAVKKAAAKKELPENLQKLEKVLQDRYGADYKITGG